MALSASTVLEVRNTADFANASDVNGGGFVTGATGTDWSYANIPAAGGPQYAVSDGVTNGTTTITSATAAFGTDVVGNLISVSGGSGSVVQAWYQIITRTSATAIVVDRTTGLTAGTSVVLKIGGALASPGQAAAIMNLAGQKAYVRYSTTTYNLTTATPGAAGPVVFATSIAIYMEGYDQTRGDRTGNRPKVSWASVAAPGGVTSVFTVTGTTRQLFANLVADCNSVNNVGGFAINGGRSAASDCVTLNFGGTAGVGFLVGVGTVERCQANTGLIGFSGAGYLNGCAALSCSTTGYKDYVTTTNCLASLCGVGFGSSTSAGALTSRCTADSCTTIGIDASLSTGSVVDSCIASNQSAGGGIGIKVAAGTTILLNNASYNNTTEVSGTPMLNEGMILNASFSGGQPYVTAGSDFRPNNVAASGVLLRNAGIGVFGQTDNSDIGAVQHTDQGASLSRVFSGF